MTEPLDELYLDWLYGQVGNKKLKNPARTYWSLLQQLQTKEYVWFIPNDDNRLEDGRDLRLEFAHSIDLHDLEPLWMTLGCSMLEMLIGLSRHLNFLTGEYAEDWFWRLLGNIGLKECTDKSGFDPQTVDEILDEVIWRTYDPDGAGGLFPLKYPHKDQREEEIWYQMSAYLLEND